jgi:MFS family permease
MIGGVFFNYLGDRFGRKPIFWLTTAMVACFMTIKTFLAPYYGAYAAFKILAATTFISIFQLPISIICEVSDANYRTWAILVSWLVW